MKQKERETVSKLLTGLMFEETLDVGMANKEDIASAINALVKSDPKFRDVLIVDWFFQYERCKHVDKHIFEMGKWIK